MGDSLIGRTAGFDPVSPGSSPGPPANKDLNRCLGFFFIFNFLILITTTHGSEENGKKFIRQLLKWNIDFLKLDVSKAGAGCMISNSKEYNALGLSYNLADIEYAKKIALEGCEQMKHPLFKL